MEEGARALLIQASLSEYLWLFAIKHAIYFKKRVQPSSTISTPHYLFTGEHPDLKNIRIFGCAVYVFRLPQASNPEPRAVEGTYLKAMDVESIVFLFRVMTK